MASPKTHKVILPNGTEARAVKLTARNNLTVLNWIPGAEYRERVSAKGQTSEQRIMAPIGGTKKVKAAYYDDWIVKVDGVFLVVKFDKVEETLFFPNSFEERKVKRAFNAWKKEFGHE